MAAGDPTGPAPGPTASTDYVTGTMNAGYVWLPGAGWVWQDSNGHISAADQDRFAQDAAAKERGDAQAGNPSILRYDPATNTYTRVSAGAQSSAGPGAPLSDPGQHPNGWLTEQQITDRISEQTGTPYGGLPMGENMYGYTQSYTYDAQGNPITLVGVTKADGSEGHMEADGTIVWDSGPMSGHNVAPGGPEGVRQRWLQEQNAMDKSQNPWKYSDDPKQRDAFSRLTDMLAQYGLGDLNQFAWEAVLNGDSQERILQNLRNTDTYKQRFPGMALRKQNGLRAISEQEYMDYERSVRQLMRESGLPVDFYDQPSDFTTLLANDVSVREVAARTSDMFAAAQNAPQEVRQAFTDYFGVDGMHALAAYFLNPDKALPVLELQMQTAQVGGTGKRFGFGVSEDKAERIARLGLSPAAVESGFQRVAASAPLFQESISESQDLTSDTGMEAAFMGNQDATQAIQRRAERRLADFTGGGGAAVTSGGVLGLQQEQ